MLGSNLAKDLLAGVRYTSSHWRGERSERRYTHVTPPRILHANHVMIAPSECGIMRHQIQH